MRILKFLVICDHCSNATHYQPHACSYIINPRRACAARVVCIYCTYIYPLFRGQISNIIIIIIIITVTIHDEKGNHDPTHLSLKDCNQLLQINLPGTGSPNLDLINSTILTLNCLFVVVVVVVVLFCLVCLLSL